MTTTRPDTESTIRLLSKILAGTPRLPEAACCGDPELFTSSDPGCIDLAIRICRGCPDLVPCRQWADSCRPRLTGVVAGRVIA
jgi:hypothetical protein